MLMYKLLKDNVVGKRVASVSLLSSHLAGPLLIELAEIYSSPVLII